MRYVVLLGWFYGVIFPGGWNWTSLPFHTEGECLVEFNRAGIRYARRPDVKLVGCRFDQMHEKLTGGNY